MKQIILFFSLIIAANQSNIAQTTCPSNYSQLVVHITPDNYPQEISYQVFADILVLYGNYSITSSGVQDTICLSDTLDCISFTIYDNAGDGICCDYGQGHYVLTLNNDTIKEGGQYAITETTHFLCDTGSVCETPFIADTLSQIAIFTNTWYEFSPPLNGTYAISTCDTNNTCDTRIWVYDQCNSFIDPNEPSNIGTIMFNDSNNICGDLALVTGVFDSSKTYIIRIGSENQVCDSIYFDIEYIGPVVGCMDPTACNYLSTATQPGVCYYFPDTICGYSDLVVSQAILESSLFRSVELSDFCSVQEGCLGGYGNRTVINFSTRINNIGNKDYHIGRYDEDTTGQFSVNNCHGHPHYEGYAKYSLIDQNGNTVPVGSKSGFCVLDISCPDPFMAKFDCDNMGISAGCEDEYSAGLPCQFVDITDVDTGLYTLRVEVNWDHSPDNLGYYEKTYDNNYGEVCIRVLEDNINGKYFAHLTNCNPWLDCAGVPRGSSVRDCNGICNGTAEYGDVNIDNTQSNVDAHQYLSGVLGQNITVSPCYDLNDDSLISVFDAALLNRCVNQGTSYNDYCVFPRGVYNPNEGASFSVENHNTTDKYFEVFILNPLSKIMGYELTIKNAEITNVKNILNDPAASIAPEFLVGGNKVIALAYTDSFINKNFVYQPLIRIYYQNEQGIPCLDSMIHVVNSSCELIPQAIDTNNCQLVTGKSMPQISPENFLVYPNPASKELFVENKSNMDPAQLKIRILNTLAQPVLQINMRSNLEKISLEKISKGFYYVEVSGLGQKTIQKVVLH